MVNAKPNKREWCSRGKKRWEEEGPSHPPNTAKFEGENRRGGRKQDWLWGACLTFLNGTRTENAKKEEKSDKSPPWKSPGKGGGHIADLQKQKKKKKNG